MRTNTQEALLSAYIASIGKSTPREAAQNAAELCRLANSLNRLNEIACNCGLTERQERRKQNLQTRINVVLERAGFIAASGVDTQEYFDRVVWQRRPVWVSNFRPKSSLLDGMDGNSNLRAIWK